MVLIFLLLIHMIKFVHQMVNIHVQFLILIKINLNLLLLLMVSIDLMIQRYHQPIKINYLFKKKIGFYRRVGRNKHESVTRCGSQ